MSCSSLYCRNCNKMVLPRDVDSMLRHFQLRYTREYSLNIIQQVMDNHSCSTKTGLDAFFDY